MPGVIESCSVCRAEFEVQFRYQMEEREGGFAFYCSQECQGKAVRGEDSGGVTCDACSKRFAVELVSQVVCVKGARRYACSLPCRSQLLAEGEGARLGAFLANGAPLSLPPPCSQPISPPTVPSPLRAVAPPTERMHIDGPRRLAIFNHKGGTGKTTTSVSIAAGLASRGARVLLVDTDSQGNVSVSLNVKAERSLYHVLVMGLRASEAIVSVRPNLDLIVANETLAAAELYLAGRQSRDRVLQTRLAPLFDAYDVIVLDCSPSLSLMNQNALVVAEGVLVPVACRCSTGHQDHQKRQHTAPSPGANLRRFADLLRRARPNLSRRSRHDETAFRRSLPPPHPGSDEDQRSSGAGEDHLRICGRLERCPRLHAHRGSARIRSRDGRRRERERRRRVEPKCEGRERMTRGTTKRVSASGSSGGR
jgi:hypothetical protein